MNGSPWLALVVAAALAFAAGWVVRPIARRLRVVDVPGGRKGHARATPLLGGTALLVGWCAGLAAGGGRWDAVAVGAVLAWALGTLDDVRTDGLRPRVKLAGQLVVVTVWVLASGLGGVSAAAGFCVVLFAMNGFNLLDNTDGLCATAALGPAIGCAWLAAAAGGDPATASVAAHGLVGALGGFLLWNLPPARLFLGDGGSHLIGFLIGARLVDLGSSSGAGGLALWAAAGLFLLLPLLDTVTVVVARARRGIPPWVGDRRHLSHRLHRAGWREPGALLVLGAISALGAALGVLVRG